MMGFESPPELLDVDRIGFDRALFDQVVANEHCTHVDTRVEAVEYDRDTDTIESVSLQNGETFDPDFVFDCTNAIRLLGRMLQVPVEWLGTPNESCLPITRHEQEGRGSVS